MKIKLFPVFTAAFFGLIATSAMAGTGWVGNSPLVMASNDSSIIAARFKDISDYGKPHNSLLLREGKSRLALGYGSAGAFEGYGSEPGAGGEVFGFDYGLSDQWTLLNLTSLGYDLRSGKDDGNELAIYFGAPGGIGYSTLSGFVVGTGAQLLHRVQFGTLTLTNALIGVGQYKSKIQKNSVDQSRWESAFIKLRHSVALPLGSRWSSSLGMESHYGRYNDYIYDNSRFISGQQVKTSKALLVGDPSFSLSRHLLDRAVLTWTLAWSEGRGYDSGSTVMTTGLVLSTEW